MKAVIYESNAGSTKRYAELLAAKLNVKAYSLKEAAKQLPAQEEAVFMGWVFANKIQGLKKAQKKWKLSCVCAVGMNAKSAKYDEILKEANPVEAPVFYLRGALDFSRLKWLQRKLLEAVRSDMEKQNKPGTEESISVLKNGCDFVSEENLADVIAYLMINE